MAFGLHITRLLRNLDKVLNKKIKLEDIIFISLPFLTKNPFFSLIIGYLYWYSIRKNAERKDIFDFHIDIPIILYQINLFYDWKKLDFYQKNILMYDVIYHYLEIFVK